MGYPMKLKPVYKDYIWGGEKLKSIYKKQSDNIIAESWELSCHEEGKSIIENGKYENMTLYDFLQENKNALGENSKKFSFFPMMIKLIDAADNLSVQVHPEDEYALKNENQYGKTEMWYVAEAEKDAFIYFGFSKDIDKKEFVSRIENKTVTEVLNKVYVKKGDIFFIEAGTVHAIGKGCVIAEIQQNSNITYRIYDYDRKDKNGQTRELHIDKAVEVINFDKLQTKQFEEPIMSSCDYFTVRKLDFNKENKLNITNKTFKVFLCLEGYGKIGGEEISKGETVFLPANIGEVNLEGNCFGLLSYVY